MSQKMSQFIDQFLREHSDKKFDVLDFFIDTSVSKNEGGEIVPYLNILLANFIPDEDMQQLLNEARENEDMGFFYDGFNVGSDYYESYFEFELSDLKEEWSHIANVDGDEFVSVLNNSINEGNTSNIKFVIFHFVDDFDVKFLKKDA